MKTVSAFGWLLCLLFSSVMPAQAANLRWAAQNDTLTFDPHSHDATTTNTMLMHVYEGLTRYSKTYQIEPSLATSWEQLSPTLWRFKLRQHVRFHDGSPFTADDVVFSFARVKQPQGRMQIYVSGINEIRKIDDFTVEFVLAGPNPILLRNIIDFRIMSKAWAIKTKSESVQNLAKGEVTYSSHNANGTGPYMLQTWETDRRVVFNVNPNWWDKPTGNVTTVTFLPIKSDATRVAGLISGELDLITDVPPQDIARLRSHPNLTVLEGHEARTLFIGLDLHSNELIYSGIKGRNPFKDLRVRQALNLAVDRDAIKRVTMRGLSVPAGIMVAPGVQGYAKDIDNVTAVDVDQAKKLLAEAGYPNGFDFTLDCPNNRYVNDEQICTALVGQWARAGLKVRLNSMPLATFIPKILKHDTSTYMLGWGVTTFDSLYMLQALARTKTSGADGNFNAGRVSDSRLDAIIDAIKTETDNTKRDALIREALIVVRDQAYFVPLHHQVKAWAMKKSVTTTHRADDRAEARFVRME